MYKSTAIGGYIIELFKKIKADIVKDRDDKKLTPAEGAAINEQIKLMLQGEFIADKPSVNPGKIVAVYGPNLPALKRLTDKNCQKLTGVTKAQREEIRREAAYKYAEGLTNIQCYSPLTNEDLPASRQEQAAYFALDDNYKDLYVECFRQMKDDYYDGKGLTDDEIAGYKAAAKDSKNRLTFKAINDMITNRGELYNNTLDDATLIDKFPQIATDSNLLNEVVVLLGELKNDLPQGIRSEQVDELISKAYNMSAMGTYYTKRMAMLADPYYPEINLEELYKANPVKVNEVADVANEMLMNIEENHGFEVTSDEDVLAAKKNRELLRANKGYANKISANENIINLPADAAFATKIALDAKITRLIGGTMSEARRGKIFCDKDGNVLNLFDDEIVQALKDNDGEIYIIDKEGKHNPVPVIIDKSKKDYQVLVGNDAVTACANELRDPQLTRWDKFCNWTYKLFHHGEESANKMAYNAKLEFNAKMRALRNNQAPDAVKTLAQEAINRSNLINDPERKASRERLAENILAGFKHISLEDPRAFDYALSMLLANKGLNAESGRFRDTMHRVLGAYDKNFKESINITNFRNREQFREFAWRLRQDEELMKKLGSGDKVQTKEALEAIINRFVSEFDVKEPWDGIVSSQFKEYIAKEDKKLGITVDEANGKVISEQDEDKLRRAHNNNKYWENIRAFYGSNRQPRLDWMPETSSQKVYYMREFMKMKENDEKLGIDLKELKIKCKGLDEDTFASLGMMLSLKQPKAYISEDTKERIPDTTTFEDIVLGDEPRPNIRCVLNTIVETTREQLVKDLKDFSFDGQGRKNLAKKLAESLKLFSLHSAKFGWGARSNCALVEVADNVMNFIERNYMLDEVMAAGLDKKDLSHIRTTIAVGKAANEGFEAETKLTLEANGDKAIKLTDEQRLDCINKVMRLKVIQADNELMPKETSKKKPPLPVRNPGEKPEDYNKRVKEYGFLITDLNHDFRADYSQVARSFENKGFEADMLAESLMPMNIRKKLAKNGRKGSKEFFDRVIKDKVYAGKIAKEWKTNKLGNLELVQDAKASEKSKNSNHNKLIAM